MTPRHSRIAWTFLGLFATAFLLAADKPSAVSSPQKPLQTGEAAIEKALQQPIDLVFNKMPLGDVVKSLRERCGIEIYLAEMRLFYEAGINIETPVTCDLHNLPLRSGLNLMLKPLGATWTIQNDVLFITTPEEADNSLMVKLYDASDLEVCRDKHDAPWDDYTSLIEMIETTIRPNSWQDNGGPGGISGDSLGTAKILAVSQTYQIQGEVADLLEKIREVAKKTPCAPIPRRDPEEVKRVPFDSPAQLRHGAGTMAINDSTDAKKEEKKTGDAKPKAIQLNPTTKPATKMPPRKLLKSGRAAIEKALEQPVDFHFNETPLAEVVELLRNRHEIEIQLDEKPLSEASITRETPITEEMRGVPLKSGLQLLLKKIGVTWVIENDVLLITTWEERDSRCSTRVHDVSDLVVCQDDRGILWDDYNALVKVIQMTVHPNNWAENGGPWTIAGNSIGTAKALAVTAPDYGHDQIAELLKNIREIAQKNLNAGPPRRNRPPAKPAVTQGNATGATAGNPATAEKKDEKDEKKPGVATPNP
jgi:hypothetical protein